MVFLLCLICCFAPCYSAPLVFDDWPGWAEVPQLTMQAWRELPPGIHLNPPVFEVFAQHFTATLLRDGLFRGSITQHKAASLQALLTDVSSIEWSRYCLRHNYPKFLHESHPHWDQNFACCPVFREDRESPLLVKKVWDVVSATALTESRKLLVASFVLFARRVFHNIPPSWHVMMPYLLDLAKDPTFDADTSAFASQFKEWASGQTSLYGKASHWYAPDVNDQRQVSCTTIGWIDDSIQLLRDFWAKLPFVHAVGAVGDVADRSWAVAGLLHAIPGVAEYGIKFVQGDLLELYKIVADGVHELSLRTSAAVGPAGDWPCHSCAICFSN